VLTLISHSGLNLLVSDDAKYIDRVCVVNKKIQDYFIFFGAPCFRGILANFSTSLDSKTRLIPNRLDGILLLAANCRIRIAETPMISAASADVR
jgi:hypothetical protein